jgi:hypothetical protein
MMNDGSRIATLRLYPGRIGAFFARAIERIAGKVDHFALNLHGGDRLELLQ